jgi:hypothetical protein
MISLEKLEWVNELTAMNNKEVRRRSGAHQLLAG